MSDKFDFALCRRAKAYDGVASTLVGVKTSREISEELGTDDWRRVTAETLGDAREAFKRGEGTPNVTWRSFIAQL